MLRNFMTLRALSKGKKPEGGLGGNVTTPFPGEEAVMLIYGGSDPHEYWRKLKLTSQEVHTISSTIPEYPRWSESSITFDQTDHPDCIMKPEGFPS
jgi:hypothetical protein